MSKVRVYELARELNIETKMLVNRIKGMGIDIASHQSSLSDAQVDQIRRELKGGATAAPQAATASSTAGATKVVIRRRRPSEAEVAEEQPAPAQAAEPEARVVAEEPTKDMEEEPQPHVAAAPEEPAVTAAPIHEPAAEPARPAPMAPAASAAAETRPAAAAPARSEPPKDQQQPRRFSSSGGATIVRRASPEEIAAQKKREEMRAQQQQAQAAGRARRPTVFGEDKGLRSIRREGEVPPHRSGGVAAPGVAPSTSEAPTEEWRDATKTKDKRRLTEVAEEPAKKAVPKQRRSQLSTRTLLESLKDLEGGEEEETIEAPAPVEDAESRRKTVYMPTASTKKRDLRRRKDLKKTQITTPRASYRVVKMAGDITVGELARQLGVKAAELIKKLMGQGVMATLNQPIDFDTATLMANEYGFEVQSNVLSIEDVLKKSKYYADVETSKLKTVTRPPIVTIMGHVDHGKTSILDAIRKSKVAAGEAGGITQHIGAYTVEKNGKPIAFLDTPGHEAFSSMRSRGAEVTDVVILVVAADDGVMPQTKEAISHAKAAKVPLIVAINKIDKPNINLDRIYTELMEQGIQAEDWGGETQFVKVSALTGQGIEDLLENINLLAELLDLKAAPDGPVKGVVVEAHLDKGRGPVATIMVQEGTLKTGDYLVAGMVTGRVRFMTNHRGERLEFAGPSTPVEVIGLSEVPMAGDSVYMVEDERTSKEIADFRAQQQLAANSPKSSAASLEELLAKVQDQEVPEVPVILKADTQGSVEAIAEALTKLNTPKVKTRVVHKAVGGVSESDIMLAKTSGAVLVAFNVRAGRGLDEQAEKQGVPLRYFSVIYDLVNAVKSIMAGKLPPIVTEVVQGHAEVRQTIKVPKIGVIAGTAVIDGKITRNSNLRLIRDNVVIYAGKIGSLRRFKDDVKEVMQGYECGIGIDGYQDIREGDVIESYVMHEEAPTL